MNLKKMRYILAIAAAGVLLSGCGGSGGNGSKGIPPISSVNPVQTGTLEFAVGTANIYGSATGMNVVSTYRQANGLSNVLVDTPTITGPFTFPAPFTPVAQGGESFDAYSTLPAGPGVLDGNGVITGTSQLLAAGTQPCPLAPSTTNAPCAPNSGTGTVQPNTSTFGQSGGVFVNGLSPGNSTNGGVAASYDAYQVPLYFAPPPAPPAPVTATTSFLPWGGPPAFDPDKDNMGLRDGLNNLGAGVLGIPEGFTVFDGVTMAAGSYTLSLAVPTGFNGPTPTTATVTKSATVTSTVTLPTLTAPALALDGAGGGTVTLPATDFSGGITEVYVQIVDYGDGGTNCQGVLGADGGAGPVYYTLVAKASGTYTLPDANGPNLDVGQGPSALKPSPSICTAAANTTANGGTATPGDSYTVQIIGTDYDMYDATYPISTSASPTLTGASGQADITISAPSAEAVSP